MDQEIRNKLRNVVTQCRRLLEDSISQDLEGKYTIFAKKDQVTADPNAQMDHLTEEEQTARKDILDHLAHINARGFKPKDALDQLVREIAFTHLNRLCAYKMMEAREVYVGGQKFREAVSRGVNSNGVKFYLADHPDDERRFKTGHQDVAYRHFLDWLGGTLSDEIGVLFSPNDPANRLYPRQKTLDDVLDLLNGGGIKAEETELREAWPKIWSLDETIGWVYQYFTPKELRDQARNESPAPRNSYELAFRNQFFTPRYVVEFLTDNTLGRIWSEMLKGDTKLKDQCRYMVRRPVEIFLGDGEQPPKDGAERRDDLSQAELLKLPHHIPHRLKKDPRELKILDPACGSGHFLLYCFDLLVTIYEEAHADPDLGPALQNEFGGLQDLRRKVPGLILAHNLHGIDIDLRASQIAALALWLRCQRTYQEIGLKQDRPKITRSNIVCAEPMPGEEHMLTEFVGQLEPKLLGQLVEDVFEKMKLADEAGSLLRIEQEIRHAVAQAKQQWLTGSVSIQRSLFENDKPAVQQRFDFSGVTDTQFFEQAEGKVIGALRSYAEKTQNGGQLQRRLFTDDAVRGFAFVDICHKRFDAVLMNPPFGAYPTGSEPTLKKQYPDSKTDILCAFVSAACGRLLPGGFVGAITNRTPLFTIGSEIWRKTYLLDEGKSSIQVLADLGHGVLDSALVEACAYCIGSSNSARTFLAFAVTSTADKEQSLLRQVAEGRAIAVPHKLILGVPSARLAFWLPSDALNCFQRMPSLADLVQSVDKGMSTTDDEQFVRAVWEVPSPPAGKEWMLYAKGGEYSPFVADIHLVVDWTNNGSNIKATVIRKYPYLNGNPDWVLHPETHHGYAGLTYTKRTTSSFSARVLSPDCRISDLANLIYDKDHDRLLSVLSLSSSSPFQFLLEATLPSIDSSAGGTAARHYEVGTLREVPVPENALSGFAEAGKLLWQQHSVRYEEDEASPFYFPWPVKATDTLRDLTEERTRACEDAAVASIMVHDAMDRLAIEHYGLSRESLQAMRDYLGPHPSELPVSGMSQLLAPDDAALLSNDSLADQLVCAYGGKRRFSKQSWIGDHRIELLAYVCNLHPQSIVEWRRAKGYLAEDDLTGTATNVVSLGVGCLFGRWDARKQNDTPANRSLPDPFAANLRHSRAVLDAGSHAELESLDTSYPIQIQWDGTLVDDPDHADDIVRRTREVLEHLWSDRADVVEKEACEILAVKGLRDYFRKPSKGGFWEGHISRYSKSRRKAPIYWLLQSSGRNYAIWLYYHRLNKDLLFKALVNYVEPKIRLETSRFETLRSQVAGGAESGKDARRVAKDVERQDDFLAELRDFEDKLRRAANLHLEPDLDDGVVLNIAPLHELVPWKEARSSWEELLKGEHEWSSIGKQLRQKGLVK